MKKTKIEFGIKISEIKQLDEIDVNKYSYIYFGNECCERKIPKIEFAKAVFEYCKNNKKTPVLMTSLMTDAGITAVKELISKLYCINKHFEVTINDFGMLNVLKNYPEIKINCGRLLIKMKRGPEINSGVLNEQPELFKSNSLSSSLFIDFMKQNKIERFEVDVPAQGINLPDNEKITVYTGNVLISVTRRCPYIDSNKREYTYKVKSCAKECLDYCFAKNTEYHEELIYMLGNGEFLKTEKTINPELKDKFDRIVVFPSLTDVNQ